MTDMCRAYGYVRVSEKCVSFVKRVKGDIRQKAVTCVRQMWHVSDECDMGRRIVNRSRWALYAWQKKCDVCRGDVGFSGEKNAFNSSFWQSVGTCCVYT